MRLWSGSSRPNNGERAIPFRTKHKRKRVSSLPLAPSTGILRSSFMNPVYAPNIVAGTAALVTMIVLVTFRLRAEERMMVEEFGDEYEAYRKRTNRFIPGTKPKPESTELIS